MTAQPSHNAASENRAPRVHVGLVHNFGERFATALETHQLVVGTLSRAGFDVSSSAHGEQPSPVRPGIIRCLARKFLDLGLKDAYRTDVLGFEKKKHGVPWVARKLAPALSPVEREKMWVDGQLTEKHSQVWAEAKATRADWLIVLEDDALPARSLASQLVQVVHDAIAFSLRYADLGGGSKETGLSLNTIFSTV